MRKFLAAQLLAVLLFPLTTLLATAQTVSYDGIRPDVIIDVRTSAEFAMGHIPGAIHIPHDRLDPAIHAVKGIDKNSHILLYCRSGRRSAMARDALIKQGFLNVHDGGSMTTLEAKLKRCDTRRC